MNIRTYSIDDVVVFRKTTEKFGGLSNMASGFSINVNGIIIKSAEHLYQAMRFPLNPDIQNEILSEHSPMTAKMISRKYRDKYTRPDFEQNKFKIMKWVLDIKLSQNWNTFGKLLLETGNSPIVEYSNRDQIWGAKKDGDNYVGMNALGRLLMELREENVKKDIHNFCIQPLDIPAFLLYNNFIETICDEVYHADLEACSTN
ncbi:NADAR family protein [Edaphocola flava]|uniref:NADAR family protein n=1 Tax=Edaphocola flava TaxID=2499629 RepID=UPI00100B3146|nr:NADAR family protein [Edaphocola flava]